MVYVRLARDWTDRGGAAHGAGDMVDVDAVTLAELEGDGVVATTDRGESDAPDWAGPTAPEPPHQHRPGWAGPTAPKPDWAGPTDPPPSAASATEVRA